MRPEQFDQSSVRSPATLVAPSQVIGACLHLHPRLCEHLFAIPQCEPTKVGVVKNATLASWEAALPEDGEQGGKMAEVWQADNDTSVRRQMGLQMLQELAGLLQVLEDVGANDAIKLS